MAPWCPGGHRLVVENVAQEIHDVLSTDGASGQQATSLEEVAEAEGSLRLRPTARRTRQRLIILLLLAALVK